MSQEPDAEQVAGALQVAFSLLRRQLRQVGSSAELTIPETAALARLDRGGPSTSAAMARLEQISPQSMGATLAGLEAKGLVERRRDPADRRQVVLSLTAAGLQVLRNRRSARAEQLARALSSGFSRSELKVLMEAAPLIERVAQNL
jgi:DNA-binding MarR family transcriptional regulator